MQVFIDGYRKFRQDIWPERRAAYEALAEHGQKPHALVIACSDSRLDPSMIFGAAPGRLFIVRNIGNLVPPYEPDGHYHGTSAAIEFAVRVLEVPRILVMGHAQCGAIAALLSDEKPATDFIGPWIALAAQVRERVLEPDSANRQTVCEHETIKVSIENLLTFPWIAERVSTGRLRILGAWYQIATGTLEFLDESGNFVAVD